MARKTIAERNVGAAQPSSHHPPAATTAERTPRAARGTSVLPLHVLLTLIILLTSFTAVMEIVRDSRPSSVASLKDAGSDHSGSAASGAASSPDGTCDIQFLESINYIINLDDYMNYTHFILDYIDKDENKKDDDIHGPRFGGNQTLEAREDSFYMRNQTLHCGFIKGSNEITSTGFDIDVKDKIFMHTCKVVVSSCIFKNSDFIRRPIEEKISAYSKKHVCFVIFLDEVTKKKLSIEGHIPRNNDYVGLWRIIVIRNLPYVDMRRNAKIPKLLVHRLFPLSRFSIWVDSKLQLNADPMLILEYFLWRKQSEYAIPIHYSRQCVWEEALENKRQNKYNHSAIDEQLMFYQSDGLVKFNALDKNAPLPSYVPNSCLIARAHTPISNLFSCLWFNEVERFTPRDQLSFGYTYLKLRRMNPSKPFHLNMFKDCERNAVTKPCGHRLEYYHPL